MRTYPIQDDLYLCIGEAYSSNSTVLIHGSDALLIESMASTKDAEQLKDFVENHLGKSVRFIVSTHYFSDHLAGLRLFPHSSILTHKNYRHTFDTELFRTEEEEAAFVEPTILISQELSIRWGRFGLRLFYNPGHTMSTINVDIPEANLIHVGDTLVGNMIYFKYASIPLFRTALDEIKQRRRTHLLSSHGDLRTSDSVDNAIHYLNSLEQHAKRAWQSGAEQSILDIAIDQCLPEGITGTSFETFFHKRNLQSILDRKLFQQPAS